MTKPREIVPAASASYGTARKTPMGIEPEEAAVKKSAAKKKATTSSTEK